MLALNSPFFRSSRACLRSSIAVVLLGSYCCLRAEPDASGREGDTPSYGARPFTVDEGMPHNAVFALRQTRDGYLSIATDRGVARFDGVRFTPFSSDNEKAFNSDKVRCLLEDADGVLWIGTTRGVVAYEHGQFRQAGLKNSLVRSLAEDSAHHLWAGTSTGIWELQGTEWTAH